MMEKPSAAERTRFDKGFVEDDRQVFLVNWPPMTMKRATRFRAQSICSATERGPKTGSRRGEV
jgi:hypothetical protein